MEAVASFFRELVLSFIPLFVAVDAPGVLPIVLELTEGMDKKEQSKMLRYAVLTALALGLGFVALGKLIFEIPVLSDSHFLVAGGLILLLLAARNLLRGKPGETPGSADMETVRVFSIGVPGIAHQPATHIFIRRINSYMKNVAKARKSAQMILFSLASPVAGLCQRSPL